MNTVASDNIFLKILETEGDDIRYQGLFLLEGFEGESPPPLCTMTLVVSDCAVASIAFTFPHHTVPALYLLTFLSLIKDRTVITEFDGNHIITY